MEGGPSIAASRHTCLRAGLLFDWLYPAHLPVLRAALEAWADAPDVTTPALKFMAEFAHNKTQRLTFDSSSPNGILLFREVSKVRANLLLASSLLPGHHSSAVCPEIAPCAAMFQEQHARMFLALRLHLTRRGM
jgi:hypothetical protein